MSILIDAGITRVGASRIVRNTYSLLSTTLLFTALVSWATMDVNLGFPIYIGALIGSFVLLFVIMKQRNSAMGLVALFGFAALEGVALGPTVSHYLKSPGGNEVVTEATFLTAAAFVGLSAYVHITRKDFSAWAGMLMTGLVVVVVASLIGFFIPSSAYQLMVASLSAIVFSGYILYDTSRLILGGETNYIMATLSLYLDVLNLFLALLRLLGGRR